MKTIFSVGVGAIIFATVVSAMRQMPGLDGSDRVLGHTLAALSALLWVVMTWAIHRTR